MASKRADLVRAGLIWACLAIAVLVPIFAAARSPLLAWRDPVYIAAGFAGILAMALLLMQPLLAEGHLPGLAARRGRRLHRWIGGALILAVVLHVVGLWLTSPPDVIDALLFRSPTPFAPFGVVAMWALFATALLASLRPRLRLRPRIWRLWHMSLAGVIALGSVIHALLIVGTMETASKIVLCLLVLLAVLALIVGRLRPSGS